MPAVGCGAVGAGCGAGVASAGDAVAGAVSGAAVGAPVGGAAVGTAAEGPVQAVRTTSAIRRVACRRCFTFVSLLFDEAAGGTRAPGRPHLTTPVGARASCPHHGGTSLLLSGVEFLGEISGFLYSCATILQIRKRTQTAENGPSVSRRYATMTSPQKRTAETPSAQRTSKTRVCTAKRDALERLALASSSANAAPLR